MHYKNHFSQMNNVKIISKILFYITRFLAGFYLLMALHSAIALLTGWSLNIKEDGKYFQIYFPLTKKGILNGDYNLPYILFEFLIPMALYGLFFLLLSNVFKVFYQPRLFSENGVKQLKRFYLGNFIIPGIVVLIVSFIDEPEIDGIMVIGLHAIIGVFAYYLAAIFKQGLALQHEKDLFI